MKELTHVLFLLSRNKQITFVLRILFNNFPRLEYQRYSICKINNIYDRHLSEKQTKRRKLWLDKDHHILAVWLEHTKSQGKQSCHARAEWRIVSHHDETPGVGSLATWPNKMSKSLSRPCRRTNWWKTDNKKAVNV